MGLDIFEVIVASWLQTKGFFIMHNIKYGRNKEIDILATKAGSKRLLHIEITCSSSPIGTLRKKSTLDGKDYRGTAQEYLEKKYFNNEVIKKIKELTNNNMTVERWLIHAVLKEPKQLEVVQKKGIKTIHINEIIKEIRDLDLKQFTGDRRIKQLFDITDENN